jgi:eukaryotic-like serine/threonine-protein kinase
MSLEGQQIGRYRLLRLLGQGTIGEVYLAKDARIEQQVAIKVLRPEATRYEYGHDEAIRLFQREAMTIAQLDHPNILPLYEYGETVLNGLPLVYLVMPLRLEGSLLTWLEQRGNSAPLSPHETAHFIQQAASALQHAHDHQIIHQDVKPNNLLIRRNEEHANLPDLLLADFGIAKYVAVASSESQAIRGTPAYMAPEQWRGDAEPATDQYALAVMAYQLLTGRLPFQGDQDQMMYQHFYTRPHPPSELNPLLSKDIDEVELHALDKQPEYRFSSISAFAHAFQQAVQSMDMPSGTLRSENISATLAISKAESLSGTNRTLVLSSGEHVAVSIPRGVRDGQIIRLEGQHHSQSGDKHTITLLVAISVSQAEKDAFILDAGSNELTIQGNFPFKPTLPATVNPPRSRNLSRLRMALLIVMTLLVMVVSVELFSLARINWRHGGNNSIGIAATALIATGATATTLIATDPYTGEGKLVLNDPMSDNGRGHSWQEGANGGGAACRFKDGTYHVIQPQPGDFHTCFAQVPDFNNFVYQVEMTMISGDYGGIVFCADSTGSTFYYLSIGRDTNFYLKRIVDGNTAHALLLADGVATSFHADLAQPNVLAVVVRNGTMTLYVNRQSIGSIGYPAYCHGQIGVFAGDAGASTDIAFSNVRMWEL